MFYRNDHAKSAEKLTNNKHAMINVVKFYTSSKIKNYEKYKKVYDVVFF